MTCDATTAETLTAGDDWVWSYTTTDDSSGWSEPVAEIRAARSATATLVASSQGESPAVSFDAVGPFSATNFADGVFTWSVDQLATADAPEFVWVEVEVLVDGIATTVFSRSYQVVPEVAVREEVGS